MAAFQLHIFGCRRGFYLFDRNENLFNAVVWLCQPLPDPQTAGLKIKPANQKCDVHSQMIGFLPCVWCCPKQAVEISRREDSQSMLYS